jgi:hypothetical protein
MGRWVVLGAMRLGYRAKRSSIPLPHHPAVHQPTLCTFLQTQHGAHPSAAWRRKPALSCFRSSNVWYIKIQDKVVPMLDYAARHEGVRGSEGIAPPILNLDTRWRRVVSFTPRPLYPSVPVGHETGRAPGLHNRQAFPSAVAHPCLWAAPFVKFRWGLQDKSPYEFHFRSYRWKLEWYVSNLKSGLKHKNWHTTWTTDTGEYLTTYRETQFITEQSATRDSYLQQNNIDHSEDLDVDGTIMSEWILGKQGGKLWIRFICIRIGTSGGLLWTR